MYVTIIFNLTWNTTRLEYGMFFTRSKCKSLFLFLLPRSM